MAIFIFFFSLFLYVASAFPSTPPEDSQEFIATVYTLGVPHPPGYPAFVLIYRFLSILIPFGSFTLKLNIVTSIISASAILFLFKAIKIIVDYNTSKLPFFALSELYKTTSIFVSVILILTSRTIWYISTFIEVYALGFFFTAVVIYLVLRAYFENDTKAFKLSVFLFGLAVVTHPTIIFILPLLLVVFLRHRFNIWGYVVIFIFSLTTVFFIPIRQDAIIFTGEPSITGFLRILTRADYGSFKLYQGEGSFLFPLKFFLLNHMFDFLIITTLLGLYGLFTFKDIKIKIYFFTIYVLSGFIYYTLADAPQEPYFKGVIERFLWLSELSIVLFTANALYRVFIVSKVFIYVFLLLVLLQILLFSSKNFNRYNFITSDYRTSIFRTIKEGVVFSPSDTLSFSILYENVFRNRKIEQIVYHKTKWGIKKNQEKFGVDPYNFYNSLIQKYANSLYFEVPKTYEELPYELRRRFPFDTYSTGMLYSYANFQMEALTKAWYNVMEFFILRNYYTSDYFSNEVVKRYAENITNLQTQFDLYGFHEEAKILGMKSINIYRIPENFNNLGVTYFHIGDYNKSAIYFRKSIELKKEPQALYNLYLVLRRLGNIEAIDVLKEACKLSDNQSWIFELAEYLYSLNRHYEALEELKNIKKMTVREYKLKMQIAKSINDPELIKETMQQIKEELPFVEQLEVLHILK
ncbi:MAG: DUF2723 domain-containing protein [bacterium]|nr:DUF2723 domain-containing protein [bacterium]